MDALPWPAEIGVSAGGWTVAATVALWVVRAFIKGDLFPKRTVEELERRNERQEQLIGTQERTIQTLTESTALSNAVMENLNRAANEVSPE